MQLDDVSKQITEFVADCPANKNKFCKHIKNVIQKAEKYGQYLRAEWQKAKQAGLTQYDKNKDKEKWFFWTALSNGWSYGECVYFAYEELFGVQFYIEGKPKPDPLAYLRSMIYGSVGQVYEGLELLDYQFVLLAIIHDWESWKAGRKSIYFNPLEEKTFSGRLCHAVWNTLKVQHATDVQQTIETALLAVKEEGERKSIIWKISKIIGIIVVASTFIGTLVMILEGLHNLGWLEPIKALIHKIMLHK
jgi:hypothetical protein